MKLALDRELPTVVADAAQLERAFANLLENADAPTATRCSGCWSARSSIGSSSRPPQPGRMASPAKISSWLLEKAPAEVLILRPAPSDERRLPG